MCVHSMVIDQGLKDWQRLVPQYPQLLPALPEVSRAEFEDLKKKYEALLRLVQSAKEYDTATGQQNCESPEKVKLLPRIADLLERIEKKINGDH